jgi:hypothetical protein
MAAIQPVELLAAGVLDPRYGDPDRTRRSLYFAPAPKNSASLERRFHR